MLKLFIGYVYGFLIAFMFNSCAQQVVYKEVKVPITCNVEIPKKPAYTDDFLNDLKEFLIYSEILEKTLYFCVYGKSK